MPPPPANQDGEEAGDPRMAWFENRVLSALKMKPADWKKFAASEEARESFAKFFEGDGEDARVLFLTPTGGSALQASLTPPAGPKRKFLYFLKRELGAIPSMEKLGTSVIAGDLSPAVLEQLSTIGSEVFMPLLASPAGHEGLPDIVTKGLLDSFHQLLANTYVTIGQTAGRTLLPLPPTEEASASGTVSGAAAAPSAAGSASSSVGPSSASAANRDRERDRDRVHVLESAVVTWSNQIKSVLYMDPEAPLKSASNPGPLHELEFWESRAQNLNSIREQLASPKISKVTRILELANNTYYDSFRRQISEVEVAAKEASEIVRVLRPLRPLFEQLSPNSASRAEFSTLTSLFPRILHLIFLVWTKSEAYRTPSRLVCLIREICNDLVEQARQFVDSGKIFDIEPQESADKLNTTLQVCGRFKDCFFQYKSKVASEFPDHPWRIQSPALFHRLDLFLERCNDIQYLTESRLQFAKLAEIEIGGTQGRSLTSSVRQVHGEFAEALERFRTVQYDLLDVSVTKFEDDFHAFRSTIKELERRLGSILGKGFEDCGSIFAAFKLVESFEGLLDRDIIRSDLEKKQAHLLASYGQDLHEVQEIFHAYREHPPAYSNMPPTTGAIVWCKGLLERINEPMSTFHRLNMSLLQSEEAREIVKLQQTLSTLLAEYQKTQYQAWAGDVSSVSKEKLKQPLLRRDADTRLLHVNFDPALVRLLREVHYIEKINSSAESDHVFAVPGEAQDIYQQVDVYRTQTSKLDLIVSMYNTILTTLLDVERPLFEEQLQEIDQGLQRGLEHLNWKSPNINEFIEEMNVIVSRTSQTLKLLKEKVAEVQKLLEEWAAVPLLDQREAKPVSLAKFQSKYQEFRDQRFKHITDRGAEIHAHVTTSYEALRNIDRTSPAWRNYVHYVNDIVIEGICRAIVTSLSTLRAVLDPNSGKLTETGPVLEVVLRYDVQLDTPPSDDFAEFHPYVREYRDGKPSVEGSIQSWLRDFKHIATLLGSRLDTGDGDYMAEVEKNAAICELVSEIERLSLANMAECAAFRGTFLQFAFLWIKNDSDEFQEFFDSAPKESAESPEPTLESFQERIAHFESVAKQINMLKKATDIGWLRVDASPLKSTLATLCSKWRNNYTEHLSNRVQDTLNELSHFMDAVSEGIQVDVPDNNLTVLKAVMGHIRQVLKREEAIENMWEPLRNIVNFLKKCNSPVPDAVLGQLENYPQMWNKLKTRVLNKRAELSPLQDKEAEKIKVSVDVFAEKVTSFRRKFEQDAPFEWTVGVDVAYDALDRQQETLVKMERENEELKNLQGLFGLSPTDFRSLKMCRSDLVNLKQVWDMSALVKNQFDSWMLTPFKHVDVDSLTEEARKLQQLMRGFNKEIKSYNVYNGLDATVQNMLTALPLISDLRNPAMRPRHWKQLLTETHKTGNINPEDESFCLQQLVDLGLHEYVEEVSTIVDKAMKELSIEKNLLKIKDAWALLVFEYEYSEELKVHLMKLSDEIMEAVEEHQMILQGMAGSRNVEFFEKEVTKWANIVGAVDESIRLWTNVQGKWSNLYPIFVLSADIREQLPEDSKRFEGIDRVFRNMMDKAKDVTNVVEACYEDTIQQKMNSSKDFMTTLRDMEGELEKCEKALADYLETKRKIFPRFYFVSPADLVDILSKGSTPHLIMRHIGKLVDSLDTLVFEQVAEGAEPSKKATGMISKEGEQVMFRTPFLCEGAVEDWLNGLISHIADTLRHIMTDAATSYAEPEREAALASWLEAYPAQIVTATSRIWWTRDVDTAFGAKEDGNANAIRDYNKQQVENLNKLAALVRGELSGQERRKIITLITIEVHARDVVTQLVQNNAENHLVFAWQSQLRMAWDDESHECTIMVADAEFRYGYEYIGNCGCLVITPLTDRCYITLTQALRLIQGGAPAGPAGTGKTETTKDLGRALGMPVYVFNCSEQMGVTSLGNIFKGLCMTGAWGCFDEFNRIAIEVLSVVATQFKSILDGLGAKASRFNFENDNIPLIPTVGVFITMNPGYKGRTELPENLKALFRPCAMVVPDLLNICEIMLASEGFEEAKPLSKKFVTLYMLNRELLSKQIHYDWGLRAVKSVLVIAGELKRAEPQIAEEKILMRALRDTNMAKLARDDVEIFRGLITDLFPDMELPPKRDLKLEDAIRQATQDARLQAGERRDAGQIEMFILKVMQFKELLDVRHSVFVLGPAGAAKSAVWTTLAKSLTVLGKRVAYAVINPKAVSSNELYGYVHKATGEWRDGLLSVQMRNFADDSKRNKNPKWIVLDGDIDTEWIESMNTVMDDNKVLTLASNERIPLTPSMRMVFEISHLRNASPATVSRAGILFLNETDIGWGPFKDSWIDEQPEKQHALLTRLFDTYVPDTLEFVRKNCKHIIPVTDYMMVQTLCFFLEALLGPNASSFSNELFEHYFVFAAIWAIGGGLADDGGVNHRNLFSNYWRKEYSGSSSVVKVPDAGTIFDYFVDPEQQKMRAWADIVPTYQHQADVPFASIFVPTVETVRLTYLSDMMLKREDLGHPVMFVGTAGTAKTAIMRNILSRFDEESYIFRPINFNSNTDSLALQTILEQNVEKQGRDYGPPGRRKCIFFLDDLNMPTPDKYGTQSAIALVRQHMDYGFWYDRLKQEQKSVKNLQYVACMNPKAGSFIVDERLQRHFAVMAVLPPSETDLRTIFQQVFRGHLKGFVRPITDLGDRLVEAVIQLHSLVVKHFIPTSVKFHYVFTLRDVSNVFQGLCKTRSNFHKDPLMMGRLWAHECMRVYGDRLINEIDQERFQGLITDVAKAQLTEFSSDVLFARPLLFTSFLKKDDTGTEVLAPVDNFETLRVDLDQKLEEYNESHAVMNLELFEQAMEHVCRISRILALPRGNALLVGVGGSGKQSLARLSASIFGMDVFSIVVRASYGMTDFKTDIIDLYQKAAIKPGTPRVFLMNDSQIIDERMLVYINDMLSSGNIPDLFTPEEREEIIGSMTNEVKQMQAGDYNNKDVVWEYFINKVRDNVHVVLAFSPVGEQFRIRCRKFPALSSCTVIDWFHAWPRQALVSVANRFLSQMDLGAEGMRERIAEYMAFVHGSVEEASLEYLSVQRRYNYTTPKSFLELIVLYMSLLSVKREDLEKKIYRLESGLSKLLSSSEQVAVLQEELRRTQVRVEEKKVATDALLERVGRERSIVEKEAAIADVEKQKTQALEKEATDFAESARDDLEKTVPIVQQALAALDTLNKKSIDILKSLGKPPQDVQDVAIAVLLLTSVGPVPKNPTWNDAKKMMGNPMQFIQHLQSEFDIDHIPQANVDAVEEYVTRENFDPVIIATKSGAAGGLCDWVINIVKYHKINLEVAPLKAKLAEAQEKLAVAQASLQKCVDHVNALQAQLDKLLAEYEEARQEKMRIEQQARETAESLDLAERLVNGLADERVRWGNSIDDLKNSRETLVGDVLLAAAFLSYIGPFSRRFREDLLLRKWVPTIFERSIPTTPNMDPLLGVLTDEATIAKWTNQALPADRISQENGAIVTNCKRWPLLIDPQLQGVRWVKNMEAANDLKVLQLSKGNYMREIKMALQNGNPVLIENLGETIDAVLEPIISRSIIKRGRNQYIRLGEEEISYHPTFRLYLQTKLSNPHYRPEVHAQTTLINFMVTEDGLEDQLLAVVVNNERPELEEERVRLLKQMNQSKIDLKACEDSLLNELNSAQGDLLKNVALVESLENTKKKAVEISEAMARAVVMNQEINVQRNKYRLAAVRGSLVFFLIDQLALIDHMYQFSLEAFMTVFVKGLKKSPPAESAEERVLNIQKTVTETIFSFVSRGLFERHKLIFSSMLTFLVMRKDGRLNENFLQFLMRGPKRVGVALPETCASWLPQAAWDSIQALSELEGTDPAFSTLPTDLAVSWRRFKEWSEMLTPEDEKLPSDWKNLSYFEKLLVIRCLRPDRITMALSRFVALELGQFFVEDVSTDLKLAFEDSSPTVPIFFILSPGVDPVKSVESLGRQMGFEKAKGNLWNVSLGQGQDVVAERALQDAYKIGGWVILNNIHLMSRWLIELEKQLDTLAEGYDPAKTEGPDAIPAGPPTFRIFLSAEPNDNIPIGILQRCIKLTNEPPQGLRANMNRALANFSDEVWENTPKQAEFKAMLFALCFFHGVVIERKKFGAQGWNRSYPFNFGDLTTCVAVLNNYLDERPVPWEDLRYIYGEIMYGGHITDDWDRRLCSTYLQEYIRPELVEGSLCFFESFQCPPPATASMAEFRETVDTELAQETPKAFGLPPNAEIGFRTAQGEALFKNIMELQPRGTSGGGGVSVVDRTREILTEISEGLPPQFNMLELSERLEERDPYQNVFMQECERMNRLLFEIKRSLEELAMGLSGELSMSEKMEQLMNALYLDRIPERWESVAYASLRPLGLWIVDLHARHQQLADWVNELVLPKVVWLSGFFNPQSFVTAVLQVTARRQKLPLDKMILVTDVTKKQVDQIESAAREGWYIHGLYIEGASWDLAAGQLEDAQLKELHPPMPVIHAKASFVDAADFKDSYMCPVYKTQERGATYVCTANLRTKARPSKWIMAGCALLLDVV